METDLSKIPIRQDTVEICEFYSIDPYKMISSGSMLIAAKDGAALVEALEKEGIHAAVIGKTTEKKSRIVHYDGQDKYLGAPDTDEIYKVLQ